MQTSEREVYGLEVSPSVNPEASLESPPAPTKSPAFDLFNLVVSYKRLEIYLEPLKDAGDGVRYLLRYRFYLELFWPAGPSAYQLCGCTG